MTDDMTPSYWDCLHAGMTQAETAKARGVCVSSVTGWASRNGVRFKPVYMTARDVPADKYQEYRTLVQLEGFTQAEALAAIGMEGMK